MSCHHYLPSVAQFRTTVIEQDGELYKIAGEARVCPTCGDEIEPLVVEFVYLVG